MGGGGSEKLADWQTSAVPDDPPAFLAAGGTPASRGASRRGARLGGVAVHGQAFRCLALALAEGGKVSLPSNQRMVRLAAKSAATLPPAGSGPARRDRVAPR